MPFAIAMLVASLASFAVAAWGLRRGRAKGIRLGALAALTAGVGALSYALQLIPGAAAGSDIWVRLQGAALLFFPVFFFAFALHHAGIRQQAAQTGLLLLIGVPLLAFLLLFPAETLGPAWVSIGQGMEAPLPALTGFWLAIPFLFAAVLFALGMAVLIRAAYRQRLLYSRQLLWIVLSGAIPIGALLIDTVRIGPMPRPHLTPVSFALSGLVVLWSLTHLHEEDLLSFSKGLWLRALRNAVLIVDADGGIIEANQAAEILSGMPSGRLIRKEMMEVFPNIAPLVSSGQAVRDRLVEVKTGEGFQTCRVDILPVRDAAGGVMSCVVSIHPSDPSDSEDLPAESRAALARAAAVLRSTLNYEEVLRLLAEEIGKAVGATSAYISSLDHGTLMSEVLAEYYSPLATDRERVSDLGETFDVGSIFPGDARDLIAGKPFVHKISDAGLSEAHLAEMQQYDAKSILTIPLQMNGRTMAYAEVWDSQEPREFCKEELELCMGIAQHAAIAIENSRLYAETEKRLAEQMALRDAGNAISSTLDLPTVLHRIAEQLCRVVDATSAYICGFDKETNLITVLAEYVSEKACPKEQVSDLGATYDNHTDLRFATRMEKGIPDHSHVDDPDLIEAERQHMLAYGAKSVLYLPMHVRGELVAYGEVWESRYKRQFTEDEINLAAGISQQAAIAIQNARLYEQAQEEIKERKRLEKELTHSAFHDALTGLPNRQLLTDRVGQALARSRRHEQAGFAVLFLDLDRFKLVNDSLGHSVGDELLKQVGSRLRSTLRELDTLGRLGGDEFVVLLHDIHGVGDAIRVGNRILKAIREPFEVGGHTIFATTSMGIVLSGERYDEPEELLRDADIALYRAKDLGRDRYAVFDEDMHMKAVSMLRVESELRTALANDQLELFYQPVVSLHDNRIVAVEALVRWRHPERGLLLPAEFISLAEETGLIILVDRWVIDRACRQLAAWQETQETDSALAVSINLSGKHLSDRSLPSYVEEVIGECGLQPNRIVFEVTESALFDDFDTALKILERLKQIGVGIHMDDFGSGYSSLSLLHNLPIDMVKIDRSFIHGMESDSRKVELVRTIVRMGENLQKPVIAEGIESYGELELLRVLSCPLGQGFLFAVPRDAEATREILQRDALAAERKARAGLREQAAS
jgi:diguanylate cyclase (GGDEF)-like protein